MPITEDCSVKNCEGSGDQVDRDLTFDDALRKYWSTMSKRWNKDENATYWAIYMLLIKHIYNHPVRYLELPEHIASVLQIASRNNLANIQAGSNAPMTYEEYLLLHFFKAIATNEGLAGLLSDAE